MPLFYNLLTEEDTHHDPRLSVLPPEWEEIDQEDEVRLDVAVQHYRNKVTGGIINSDPRLSAGALKARGVPLETIVLVQGGSVYASSWIYASATITRYLLAPEAF
jgi:hypothetical protein